jgi:hypothetical protein
MNKQEKLLALAIHPATLPHEREQALLALQRLKRKKEKVASIPVRQAKSLEEIQAWYDSSQWPLRSLPVKCKECQDVHSEDARRLVPQDPQVRHTSYPSHCPACNRTAYELIRGRMVVEG